MLNILRKFVNRKRVRVRYLYQMAIFLEEDGKNFYDKLAEKAKDVNLRNLCNRLAQAEADHKKLFQEMLSRWIPLPIDAKSLDYLEGESKKRGIFSDPPSPDASEEEMIKYAIEQEKRCVDFYLSFKKYFADEWQKNQIHKIMMEEKDHASRLTTAYPHIQ